MAKLILMIAIVAMVTEGIFSSYFTLLNKGNCWDKCGKKGGSCPSICGKDGYCCRRRYKDCPSIAAAVAPWRPHACTTKHSDCAKNPCKNGGECSETMPGYKCKCKDGFQGTNCANDHQTVASGSCESVLKEKCKEIANQLDAYFGEGSWGYVPLGCYRYPAKNRMYFNKATSTTGECSTTRNCICDIDECSTSKHNCHKNAKCTNRNTGFACVCKSGYDGDGTNCKDIDECSTSKHNCDKNAKCTNGDGGFTCVCKSGYDGDGTNCKDVNECLVNNGGCKGKCINLPGSHKCECEAGRKLGADGTCSGFTWDKIGAVKACQARGWTVHSTSSKSLTCYNKAAYEWDNIPNKERCRACGYVRLFVWARGGRDEWHNNEYYETIPGHTYGGHRSGFRDCKAGWNLIECNVNWTPKDADLKTVHVCENQRKKITCPTNEVIQVWNANWGRTSEQVCKYNQDPSRSCRGPASSSKIRHLCNNKRSCELVAKNQYLGGDPCPDVPKGVFKYIEMEYKCVKVPVVTTCGGTITSQSIIRYPPTGNYANSQDCTWKITMPSPFKLHFDRFDVEKSENCATDYLQIGDEKKCGATVPSVASSSGSLTLKFHSDSYLGKEGFEAFIVPSGGAYVVDPVIECEGKCGTRGGSCTSVCGEGGYCCRRNENSCDYEMRTVARTDKWTCVKYTPGWIPLWN